MFTNRVLFIAALTAVAARAVTPGNDKVPMFFVGNQGQASPEVRFMGKAPWLNAFFLRGEVRFALTDASVRMRFEGGDPRCEPQGIQPLPGKANFLLGTEDRWRLGVPTYASIAYRSLYPGIDMVYGGNGRELKSEYVVAPGADPSEIRIRYSSTGSARIDAQGRLVIPAGDSDLREEAPTIYQENRGVRTTIEGRYYLASDGAVGFVVGEFDHARPLIIDPVLSYSTLLGGTSSNAATALAVDASGSAYIAGITASYDFPVANPLQKSNAGSNDAFIAKFNAAGNALVYCTYLGGSGDDRAYGIAVDASGSVFVTGYTTSANFPVQNPLQAKLAGARNAFVARLNPAGSGLVYSTYLGGSGSDIGYGIAIDNWGNAYVAGDTTSSNFPASGLQRTNKGAQDAFVAKVSADGSRLVYSTYLGGNSIDHGAAIAVDGNGSAYVTGSTFSTDFPTSSAWQPSNAGGQDAFVSRLSADGNSLLYSTYLGGSGGTVAYPEGGLAIAVDGSDNAYVTGVTSSQNFPIFNPLQSYLMGTTDVFVGKFTASGTLSYCTYLGGSGQEVGTSIAVDSAGDAYVAGYGYSTDLPVTADALQKNNGGDYDAFIAKLNASGNSLLYLSYLGGNGSDAATGLALDPAGDIFVAGWTLSTNFPILNAYQATNPSNYGAFVTKLSSSTKLPITVSVTPNSGSGAVQVFSFQVSDPSGASDVATVSTLFNSTLSLTSACAVTYNPSQNSLVLLTDAGTLPVNSITPGNGSQQNSQCVLSGAGSSVTATGTQLTLNLALTFTGAASENQNVYSYVQSVGGTNTGWQQRGTWTGTTASIWSSAAVPQHPLFNSPAATLGVKIRSDVSGSIGGIRFYKGSGNNGTHSGMLYSSSGQLLAQATFTGETASGWQQVNFTTPVAIAANTTYVVAYWSATGFAYDSGVFTSSSVDNAPLHALRWGVDGPNGVYAYGSTPQFPTYDAGGNYYWADVVFSSSSAPPSVPDLTIAKSHAGDFTQGQTGATYTITVSNSGNGATSGTVTVTEALPGGLTATSMVGNGWTCTQPAGPCTRADALNGGSSYPAITITVNVSGTSAASVTNTVTVSGGGEANTSNDQASDSTTIQASGWSGTAMSIWSTSAVPQHPMFPSSAATLGVKIRSDVNGSISGIRFYKGVGNNGMHIGLVYSSSGTLLAQATFTGETASGLATGELVHAGGDSSEYDVHCRLLERNRVRLRFRRVYQ
ncbi:MAG TPA: DUF4082 domain-containing protein [Bryobacteraceae bacterium]|jgi:uncharacterized repeat protein (TIGR01451 family)|nr:DUF4082 domain-containing protein [Bryobacteraceae bacterium]